MNEAESDFIIDSSVLLSYQEGDLNAKKLMHDAIDGNISISVSAYSLFVLSGSGSFDRKAEIGFLSLLKFIDTVFIDAMIAMKAGYLYKTISSNSKMDLAKNVYGQVDLFNITDVDQHLIEDSITCAIAENKKCALVSNRTNSILESLDVERVLLTELYL